LKLERWAEVNETDGKLRLGEWRPWVRPKPAETNHFGLFERWQKHDFRYLVPDTGEVFKAPRASAGGA
jgi:hypothetical protein